MKEFLITMAVGLVFSSVGFYKFIYFISIGYGFSVAAMGAAMLIMFGKSLNLLTILLAVLFIVYGCRLGGYILFREIKSSAYRETMKKEVKDGSNMKLIAKLGIWISVAFLYACQVSPVLFRLKNSAKVDAAGIVGVIIMAAGIILESVADFQKSAAKKKNPKRFCSSGVYKVVRCPNYFGEILCWTGVFVSGLTALNNAWQWIFSVAGYICIVYIMFGGARRLELRQNRNYSDDEQYREYVKKTPIIIPLVPLYSVAKYKWLVG